MKSSILAASRPLLLISAAHTFSTVHRNELDIGAVNSGISWNVGMHHACVSLTLRSSNTLLQHLVLYSSRCESENLHYDVFALGTISQLITPSEESCTVCPASRTPGLSPTDPVILCFCDSLDCFSFPTAAPAPAKRLHCYKGASLPSSLPVLSILTMAILDELYHVLLRHAMAHSSLSSPNPVTMTISYPQRTATITKRWPGGQEQTIQFVVPEIVFTIVIGT